MWLLCSINMKTTRSFAKYGQVKPMNMNVWICFANNGGVSEPTHVPYRHVTVIWCNICVEAIAAVYWWHCSSLVVVFHIGAGHRRVHEIAFGNPRFTRVRKHIETIPYHPWDCIVYLHGWLIFMVNVGKYNIHGWYGYDNLGTPRKIDMVHLQISHLERNMIFQTSMIMFHVNLQGCN